LTPAGSTYPYMKDPLDRNIRIAPSFPPLEDIRSAMQLVGICIQLVSVEKIMTKKTPPGSWAGFTVGSQANLSAPSFRGLERIDFGLCRSGRSADMRSKVAITIFPFRSRFRASCAKPAGWELGTAVASLALLDDLMANPVVVRTPFSSHKRTLHTFFNSCTMHWNHPL